MGKRTSTGPRGLTRQETIYLLIGLSLLLLLIGLWGVVRPAIQRAALRAVSEEGAAAMRDWNLYPNTELLIGPEFSVTEDGRAQLRAVYGGSPVIDEAGLSVYCSTLRIPTAWELVECRRLPEDTRTFEVIIRR
ncbi:MAG: hypothetical protein Kow00124_30150 [Anaerolineae bacterium]